MRDYGKVYTSFWSSQNIQDLSDDGKVLALYLMTCQHNTISGVFRLPDGYAAEDLKWTAGRVSKGFIELFDNGFANRCETTKWVWVIKHFEWNAPENPNQVKAAKKCSQSIPDECTWKPEFMRLWGEYLGFSEAEINKPLSNPSETVSKPVAVVVTGAVTETGSTDLSGKPDVPMELIREIFEHWQTVMDSPRSILDPKREAHIRKVLKLGYSADQIKLAIDGCRRTPHNMGQNDRNTKFNGLDLILRSADHVDRFIANAKGPPLKVVETADDDGSRLEEMFKNAGVM
jgi:hypothetical protein